MQVNLFDWLCDYVAEEGVDVVIIAGDVYDQQSPSSAAIEALDHVLSRLASQGVAVIGISGNHDSAIRVSYLEQVSTNAGITIRGDLRKVSQPVILPGDKSGDWSVAFYPVPYIEPQVARHVLESVDTTSHDALLRIALERARNDFNQRLARGEKLRSVALAHAFVTGGAPSDSERELCVGGSAEVGVGLFAGFDYGALGHLHGRQSFGNGSLRYSGSPMAYSFSETGHTKGGWLIDIAETGEPTVTAVDFPVQRGLAKLKGSLEQLLTSADFAAHETSFIQATLTDPIPQQQALEKLRRRFPYTVELQFETGAVASAQTTFRKQTRNKTDLELGVGFLEFVTEHKVDDETVSLLAKVIDQTNSQQKVGEQ